MKENQDKYNIKKACKALNVSRSGYYKYLNHKPSNRDAENEVLSREIKQIFEENKGRYGSVRIAKCLELKGKERPESGLLVHTDQWSQFTGGRFQALLKNMHCS